MTKTEFTAAVLAAEPTLYRVAKSMLGSEADCADAAQNAILRAWERLHTLREPQYFKTWLVRILINECSTILRGRRRLVPLEQDADTPAPEGHGELYAALQALDELSAIYDALCAAGWGAYVGFDLGLVHQLDYYTGMVFCGYVEGSDARGELYNDDPVLQDARLCGTTASLCGLEAAGFEQNEAKTEQAIQRIEMLNAYLFIQSGIPVIYSGDEIGQVNDYSYKESEDSDRAADSRYLHRGHFRWDLEPQKEKKGTVQNQIFASMKKMEELKFKYRPFEGEADVWTEETYDTALLCVCRKSGNEMVTGLFNFSNEDRTAWIDMGEFTWKDLFTGEKRVLRGVPVPARGYAWYYRKWD